MFFLTFDYLNSNFINRTRKVPSHGLKVGTELYATKPKEAPREIHLSKILSRYWTNPATGVLERARSKNWTMKHIATVHDNGHVEVHTKSKSDFASYLNIKVLAPSGIEPNYRVRVFKEEIKTADLENFSFNYRTKDINCTAPVDRSFNREKQLELNRLIKRSRFTLNIRHKLGFFERLTIDEVRGIANKTAKEVLGPAYNRIEHIPKSSTNPPLPYINKKELEQSPSFHRAAFEELDAENSASFNKLITLLYCLYGSYPYETRDDETFKLYLHFQRYLRSKHREVLRRSFGAVELSNE